MSQQPQSMNASNWGLLLFLSVLWGTTFFLIGVAVKELPPLTIVLARVGLAVPMLLPFFWYYGYKFPTKFRDWVPFIGMGVLNNVLPFSFIVFGQTHITVGLTSIINAMTPLFTVIVMASFGEEKLTTKRVVGVMLGVGGVAVIQGFDGSLDEAQTLGIGLVIGLSGYLNLAGSDTIARLSSDEFFHFRSDENGWFDVELLGELTVETTVIEPLEIVGLTVEETVNSSVEEPRPMSGTVVGVLPKICSLRSHRNRFSKASHNQSVCLRCCEQITLLGQS